MAVRDVTSFIDKRQLGMSGFGENGDRAPVQTMFGLSTLTGAARPRTIESYVKSHESDARPVRLLTVTNSNLLYLSSVALRWLTRPKPLSNPTAMSVSFSCLCRADTDDVSASEIVSAGFSYSVAVRSGLYGDSICSTDRIARRLSEFDLPKRILR
jgi:hypothetical protein